MKQLPLPGLSKKQLFFGGSHLRRSHAKIKRPLSSKLPIHIVLKSSKAVRSQSFQAGKNPQKIQRILSKNSKKWGIRVLKQSNNFNHLHLLVFGGNRRTLIAFMRSISGEIAQTVTGRWKNRLPLEQPSGQWKDHSQNRETVEAKRRTQDKNNSSKDNSEKDKSESSMSFWDQRPFTRVIVGYRGYLTAKDYIEMNQMESVGFFSSQRRLKLMASRPTIRGLKNLNSG
ncbi:MAG: hypothetical protein ACK5P6_04745 [Pseudobdellovibrionaceae bacterium]